MANWVFNTITADVEVIEDMLKEDNHATFQKVVPMPETYLKRGTNPKIMSQEEIDQCWAAYEESKAQKKETCDLGYPQGVGITQEEHDELMDKYGCADWRDWSQEYWGCKWDATSDEPCKKELGEISFRTPYDHPWPFILKLSEKHPEKNIHVFWEEETGYGEIYNILNGEIKTVEEWHLAEFEEIEDAGDYTIFECIEPGGRYEENVPIFKKGKFYLDEDESMEFDTLDKAREEAELMS